MLALLLAACALLAALAGAAILGWRKTGRMLQAALDKHEATEAGARHCRITGLATRHRAGEWLAGAFDDPAMRPAAMRVGFVPFGPGTEREAVLARSVAKILPHGATGDCLVARLDPGQYLMALDGSAGSEALIGMAREACNSLGRLVADAQRLRVGVALAIGGDTPAVLIDRAEQALDRCDASGLVSLAACDPELREEIGRRIFAAEEFAAAIDAGRIEPFFQPFVELDTGRVLGFEVLARWRGEGGHLRVPGEFLPLAEESGLVGEMYFSLLAAAAAEARSWPPEWSFALNLSARQIGDRELVDRTVRTLLAAGLGPGRLELEIAEKALESDLAGAEALIGELRARGIRVTLDNFGTGGLHLRELARFRFDRIKVDPAAMQGRSGADPGTGLGLIAAAARHLGVPVLAQGIETHAGAEAAQVHGCEIGQGFLFGRPDRATACFRLEGALARRRHRVA
jgi:EAL domain-containing protein (putative c-di-GMP-specific phosphodiesterase class I)